MKLSVLPSLRFSCPVNRSQSPQDSLFASTSPTAVKVYDGEVLTRSCVDDSGQTNLVATALGVWGQQQNVELLHSQTVTVLSHCV